MADSNQPQDVAFDGARVDNAGTEVVLHLDRDPNDPRTRTPAGPLPSLDDEDQQAPKAPQPEE